MNRLPIYLILAACLASCTKTPVADSADDSICFRTNLVSVSESPLSKAEIGAAAGRTIYVTETIANTFANNGFLLPQGTGIYRTRRTWTSGQEYNFFAYMFDGDGIDDISENGRKFTMTQPLMLSPDGSNSEFSDYLLSYIYYVADGASKPLVTFEMVHATAAVSAMATISSSSTSLISLLCIVTSRGSPLPICLDRRSRGRARRAHARALYWFIVFRVRCRRIRTCLFRYYRSRRSPLCNESAIR